MERSHLAAEYLVSVLLPDAENAEAGACGAGDAGKNLSLSERQVGIYQESPRYGISGAIL